MIKQAKKTEAAQAVKRLTDFVQQGQQFEGEKLMFEKLLGEDFLLKDFATLPSKMVDKQPVTPGAPAQAKEFLVMQLEWKGKVYVSSCGAAQVVAAVKQLPKQYLPVMLKVVKDKNPKTGRMFYRVE